MWSVMIWLTAGALELEGVEVKVQMTDKGNIDDIIPKQVSTANTSSHYIPLASWDAWDSSRVYDIC